MSDNPIIYKKLEGGVALIQISYLESMNSLSNAVLAGMAESIEKANSDDDVGAIVITGDDEVFSAGGDMNDTFLPKLRGEVPYEENDPYLGGLGLPLDWTAMLRNSKPVVVAFNGLAVGGGVTCFLAADVLMASTKARFMFMFTKLGIVAEMCSSKYLAARVGFGRASEIFLSARTVEADEAYRIGLVDFLIDHDKLLDEAIAKARQIAKNPRPMTMLTKQLLDQNVLEQDDTQVWQNESDALRTCFSLPEHKEAVMAFLSRSKG
ncbi:enoyl-CoA hydratase/isomerase family protein [Candidatus Pelagadaptatus aseana]|uniref:enoyl-CoA hydratase/isomerase family protein n=1 Tax=Candidatus Pelagadaptatus aseana TaxID=3120508 RepID=UPI003C7039FB